MSRACPVFLSCLSLLTKQHFVCQITFRVCVFLHVYCSYTIYCTPHCSRHVSPNKCTTVVTVDSFPHSCSLLFGASYNIECNMKFILALKSSTNRYLLKYQLFPASILELRKIFQYTSEQTQEFILRSDTSVPILKFLFVCPVFRSNLVTFLYHTNSMVMFLSCCSVSCFLSLLSNLHFVFRSIHKS